MTQKSPAITVFGGTGFLGRAIIPLLVAEGYQIRVPSRNIGQANALKVMGSIGQIVPVPINWQNPDQWARIMDGSSAVINLLGILFQNHRQRFDVIHHQIPAQLAKAVAKVGVSRFVHVSAIGADPKSASAYGQSKGLGEQAVLENFPAATILRPSVVFGPDDDFFNRFGAMMLNAPMLPLIGGGQTLFQPVYVGDVARAVQAVLHDAASQGQIYYLGGPEQWSFEQILQYLLENTGHHRALVTLPWGVANFLAAIFEKLPNPPLTRDQILLLRQDNIVPPGVKTLADLGIPPTAIEAIVPSYLKRFRAVF